MSILNSIVATTSGIPAGSQVVARGAGAQNMAQQAVQSAVSTGAVVVALSSSATSSKERAASYGESRQVDAAFDKQESKGSVEKKRDEEKKKSLDVSA
jgi:D-arabinose 1-dehydrogenase-like Zn-dependent alcohol dehydrogenase